MSRGRIAGIVVTILLVAAGAGFLFPRLFERVDEVVDRGFAGEARVNRLLALRRLLEASGVPAVSQRGFADLPPAGHVLLVGAERRSLGPAGARRLLEWAESGGHLVVLPAGGAGEDALLEELSIVRLGLPELPEGGREAGESARPSRAEHPRADRGPVRLRYLGGRELRRCFGPPESAGLLTLVEGRGLVTVVPEARPLTNEGLGTGDNALLAWRALVIDEPPPGVVLVFRDRRPSPWGLLAARARELTVSLAVLVLAFLWHASARFGPRLPAPEPERRALSEHVRASGEYLWHLRAEGALLEAERDALRRERAGGQDGWPLPPRESLAERLGHDPRVAPERTRQALALRATRDRLRFHRAVRTLEQLRRLR